MSVQLTNTTFELRITPNKRKRDDLKERKSQQINYGNNKENHFVYNNFMEVKSIADLVENNSYKHSNAVSACNPFEVVRKPPKKKNRKDVSTDDGCFVNPALNLNGPEHVLNPFEVRRAAPLPETVHHCFENTGLNIRCEDRQIINPFEVAREAKAIAPDNPNGEKIIILKVYNVNYEHHTMRREPIRKTNKSPLNVRRFCVSFCDYLFSIRFIHLSIFFEIWSLFNANLFFHHILLFVHFLLPSEGKRIWAFFHCTFEKQWK